jgi:hypothetical protein
MQNLTDRDRAYDILYGTRHAAGLFMEATLESASPNCRHLFHRLHDDSIRDQWRVWQFLHHKGEYRVTEASRNEVNSTLSRMDHLWQTHRAAGGRGGFEPDAGRWDGAAGSRRPAWDDRERRWDDAPAYAGVPAGTGYGGGWYGSAGDGGYGPYGAFGPRPGEPGASGATRGIPGEPYGPESAYAGGAPPGQGPAYNPAAGAGISSGRATAGGWSDRGGEVSFDPDRRLPEGTHFESDRGWAPGSTSRGQEGGGPAPRPYGPPAQRPSSYQPRSWNSTAGAASDSGAWAGSAAYAQGGPVGGAYGSTYGGPYGGSAGPAPYTASSAPYGGAAGIRSNTGSAFQGPSARSESAGAAFSGTASPSARREPADGGWGPAPGLGDAGASRRASGTANR